MEWFGGNSFFRNKLIEIKKKVWQMASGNERNPTRSGGRGMRINDGPKTHKTPF